MTRAILVLDNTPVIMVTGYGTVAAPANLPPAPGAPARAYTAESSPDLSLNEAL